MLIVSIVRFMRRLCLQPGSYVDCVHSQVYVLIMSTARFIC